MQESFSSDSSEGDSYHVIEEGVDEEGDNCLDVSDTSRRLSLLEILKKDEQSLFQNTLTPRAA